ncbi:MAG: xanthine dehydrogenase family protein molybdopterin-binding subunit, partial [Acidobacteria bacterium]
VSGSATYTLDVSLPGMLHAAILRCPHAHAEVRKVDAARASKMPGIVAVLTAGDEGTAIPWYDEADKGAQSRLFDPHCRYAGEEVAAVAAETPYEAADALGAISVEYQERPFIVGLDAAAGPEAPAVYEGGNLVREPSRYQRGDVAKGFAEADVVLEETYRTSTQIHSPMEVHGSVAQWEGDQLTVWDTTQSIFDVQKGLARALKLPLSRVRVISRYMGGGFGSKIGANKHTVIAALLARRTGRPVKLVLPREDTFKAVGNRPAATMRLKAGVKKDGTLTALEMTARGEVGAYASWADVTYLVSDLYLCPNVRTEDASVYTNAGQERAFRAPGFPQCAWALEQTIDALALKIGMDPIALRLRNIPAVSQLRKGMPYTSTGLARCLEEGARAFGWEAAKARLQGERATGPTRGTVVRGVGVAACQWGYEGEPVGSAIARLDADGSLTLTFGAADIGTGTKTVMAMVAAEELGIPVEKVRIEHADSGTCPYAVASGGSQTVLVNAPAVRNAAIEVRRQLLEMASEQLKVPVAGLVLVGGEVVNGADAKTKVAIPDLQRLRQQQSVLGVGTRHPHPAGKIPLPFGAHFAEVEVDTRTGELRVLRLLGAHDSGRPMNPLTYQNQVFGGMTMGLGFALTEQRVMDGQTGRVLTCNLHDYKLPTAVDVPPEMTCVPIDPHDSECNTVGAKGLGEPATIPTAAAIANAVFDATGVRVMDTPMNPTRLAELLAARTKQAGN